MASWKSDACMKSSVSAANSRPTKSVLRTSGWLYNATPTSSSKAASLSGARQRVRGPLRPSIARVVRLSPEPNPVLLFHFRRWRFFQFRTRRVFVLLKFSLFGLGTGFYKVYGDFFEKIYANEMSFSKKLGLPLPKEAPVLGNLESPYAQVTAFYNYWLGFVTVLDFFWAD